MTEQLAVALQITAVGMGLVFGILALLWLVMNLLMRFLGTEGAEAVDGSAPAVMEETVADSVPLADAGGARRRAAAAAVAFALAIRAAEHNGPVRGRKKPPTANVSAWQAVMRSQHLSQRRPRR